MAKLTKNEKLKIINDNPILWLKNFVKIIDNNGDEIPFDVNEQQKEFINNKGKFNIIAKARQGGFSTLALGLCLFNACTKPNTNYLIVSYKQESATSLFEKLKDMYDTLPHDKYLFPKIKHNNRGIFSLDNGSKIQCSTAGLKDIGRGSTYEYIHLSEFAFYVNQEKILLSAEQSLAKNPHSMVVIETTSNGFNHYQQLFMKAYKSDSKYKAFFIPFYASLYKKQFRHDYDEAEKWYREDNQGKRLSKNDLEPDELVLHEKGATLYQLMWRRWKLLDMTLQEFYQEFPSTPMESFISTGNSVFEQGKILERMNYILPPITTNEIYNELPDVLKPYINKGLYIYKQPKRGIKYYGGVDVSGGTGNDYSTIFVFANDGEQVASFYHDKVPVYKFAEIVNGLGRYFNYAFLAIERNSYGLPLIERLRKDYQYLNLYKQKIFDQRGRKKLQLGWTTSSTNKSILISDFKEQFELDMIFIHCKETLSQMQIFIETNGKLGNKNKNELHDDLVISCALAIQGMKTGKWYVD